MTAKKTKEREKTMEKITDQQWVEAVEHARTMLEQYKQTGPPGTFAAITLATEIDLYEQGDRSDALFNSLKNSQ